MNTKEGKRCKVGELRPSQALTTFGIGSIIDLPNLSVMVMGLEDWPLKDTVEIGEQRLLASVKEVLGHQVKALRSAPVVPDTYQVNQFDASALVGIPVAPFPRWMVCPYCRRLAPLGSGLFNLETPYRTDQIRYVHANCTKPGKSPTVVPARFIVACKHGHFDDFPWREFVHHGPTNCKGGLKLLEPSATGEAANIFVQCEGENCGAIRPMSDAFKMDLMALPVCKARRPHLRDHDEAGCKEPNGQDMRMEPMLQGASNSWFGITLSALAIPQASGKLKQLVEDHWTILEKVQSEQNIELLQQVTPQLRDLSEYTPAEIWQAVQAKKTAVPEESGEPTDLKTPEWEVFIDPASAEKGRDFQLRIAAPPKRYAKYFEKIVLAERLREVRALVGFTRIESPSDYDNPAAFPENQRVRLSRTQPTWVPSSEIRGEGLFFQFKNNLIQKWCKKAAIKTLDGVFMEAHQRWRIARKLDPPQEFYPGVRFVLLHSFAHALIRQLAVECGYTTASLRERIYSRNPGEDEPEMAGVLIYTAAPDSEGTLGGLVSLGRPETLERHLDQALDNMRLCASDPLCAEHHPYHEGNTLHAASCHACLFAPETSCGATSIWIGRCWFPRSNGATWRSSSNPMNHEHHQIGAAAAQLADRLPHSVMIAAAEAVAQHGGKERTTARQAILQSMPTPDFRDATADFIDRWHSHAASVGSEAVAVALLTAAKSEHDHRHEESVEIVWTGPEPAETRFRQTEQAILEVVNTATRRLTVVSYAVYRIPRIREALVAAANRGVGIRLIVETSNRIEGQGEYDCLLALGDNVASACSVYYWPQENRGKADNGKVGILHVKCAVADGHQMFLSSANFTEYAFTTNMELGLLVTGGKLPGQVERHFERLIEAGSFLRV